MNLQIADRVALVCGGGGGLGGAIAYALAADGVRVAVADVDIGSAERVAKGIGDSGGAALPLELDLGTFEVFPDCLQVVEEHWGPVEILVNNTGGPPPTRAEGNDPELWSAYFRTMVLGVIRLTDLVLPSMRARRWGRILTSTSSGVVTPIPNLAISNALRLSLVGWSKTLAREVAGEGITVNIILPGRIATARVQALDAARAERENTDVEEVARESVAAIPMGRYGSPEEYADAAVFLASERASYITGATLRVDGGLIPSI